MVDQLSLGSKEKVVLLKVNREMILVGVSSQGVSALHVYHDHAVQPAHEHDGTTHRPRL
jgi:flagellar biogenesis protein FliO